MNMGIHLIRSAKWFSERTAVIFQGLQLTYKEFNERVNRLANAFLSMGLIKGDRVAFFLNNCHQILESYYACYKAGLVTVPLNARLSISEATQMLNHSEPKVLIIGDENIKNFEKVRRQIKTVDHFIATSAKSTSMIDYENCLSNSSPVEPLVEVAPDDLASIEYTSGTSGHLKACMLTHKNILTMGEKQMTMEGFDMDRDSIMCHVAPLSHGTIAIVLPTIVRGACTLILPGFSPEIVLQTIQKEKVTHIFLVPTMINFIIDYPDVKKYDLSSLRTIFYAGSPIPSVRLQQAIEIFGPILLQMYGLHEATASVTYLPKKDHVHGGNPQKMKRISSAGIPVMQSDVRVVNEQGKDIEPGEVGEIIQRGDDTMAGYWKNPELTAQTIINGWLHTGDMATVDEDGYIYIVDRKSDMIISGGFNIYPFEVEEVLCSHPAVFEVAVIPVPDEQWGEAVKGIVVLREGMRPTEEELIEFCKQRLASYKKPKSIDFVAELPKNPQGKVLRRILKQKYWAGQDRMVH